MRGYRVPGDRLLKPAAHCVSRVANAYDYSIHCYREKIILGVIILEQSIEWRVHFFPPAPLWDPSFTVGLWGKPSRLVTK